MDRTDYEVAKVALLGLKGIVSEERHPNIAQALDTAMEAISNYEDCRNELCRMCGKYQAAYLGVCKGCRWSAGGMR